jgi:hypothetical protein
MQLFISPMVPPKYLINVNSNTTVDHIKLRIEDKEGTPFDTINLVTNDGKRLINGTLLSSYNLKPLSTIHVLLRQLGG